jgi:hypothetical protein
MKAIAKAIVVHTIAKLPSPWWPTASDLVLRCWPGFSRA